MTSLGSSAPVGKFSALPGAATLHAFADFLVQKWPDLAVGQLPKMTERLTGMHAIAPEGKMVHAFQMFPSAPTAYLTTRKSVMAGVVPETWAWQPDVLAPR